MKIAEPLLAEIVEHAQENAKIECCGLVAVNVEPDGSKTATRVYRTENIHASALKFEIEPMELYRLNEEIEERGWEIGAIYHSHVRSAPYPSQTDIGFAAGWPGLEWLIVGLTSGAEPEVRSYLIEGAEVREVPVDARPASTPNEPS
ncbi:MAG TPA: M67 family metallopeptidase [Solirubrobacteraceae bacterium]|nr:M67 family metallopeptidase [Solirubrobacteraceae bacterium]